MVADMNGALQIELRHLRETAAEIETALADVSLTVIGGARLLVRLTGLNTDLADVLDTVNDLDDVEA